MTLDELAKLVSETLGIQALDVHTPFSSLNLDSLGVIEVMALALDGGASRPMPVELDLRFATLADVWHYMFACVE
jgi:acyl carrier protein